MHWTASCDRLAYLHNQLANYLGTTASQSLANDDDKTRDSSDGTPKQHTSPLSSSDMALKCQGLPVEDQATISTRYGSGVSRQDKEDADQLSTPSVKVPDQNCVESMLRQRLISQHLDDDSRLLLLLQRLLTDSLEWPAPSTNEQQTHLLLQQVLTRASLNVYLLHNKSSRRDPLPSILLPHFHALADACVDDNGPHLAFTTALFQTILFSQGQSGVSQVDFVAKILRPTNRALRSSLLRSLCESPNSWSQDVVAILQILVEENNTDSLLSSDQAAAALIGACHKQLAINGDLMRSALVGALLNSLLHLPSLATLSSCNLDQLKEVVQHQKVYLRRRLLNRIDSIRVIQR